MHFYAVPDKLCLFKVMFVYGLYGTVLCMSMSHKMLPFKGTRGQGQGQHHFLLELSLQQERNNLLLDHCILLSIAEARHLRMKVHHDARGQS